jgi:hypothetical protein
MKSERRHELQHNDLAEWSIRAYESVMPYRNAIIGVALLIIVGVVAWQIWHNHSESQAADGWNAVETPEAEFYPAYRAQVYAMRWEQASQTYPGTPAGEWAQVLTADSCLFLGVDQQLVNKEAAANFLKEAAGRYDKIIVAPPGPIAHERSMFGKARILESTGNLQEATTAYQDLIKAFPQGTYKAVAEQRIAALGKPETVEFYKALAEYKPKPPKKEAEKKEPEKSAAGPSGKIENMKLPENPDMPPLTTPVKPNGGTSGTAASAPKASGTAAAPKSETPSKVEPPKAEAPKSTAASSAPAASAAPPAKKN